MAMHLRAIKLAAIAAPVLWLAATPGSAPAQTAKATAKAYTPHRLADGHPDLQGTYDLATITPLERPAGAPAVYTKEEARRREAAAARQRAEGDKPISGD